MPQTSNIDDAEWEDRMSDIVDNYMKNEEEVKKISDQIFDQRLIGVFKSKLKIVEKEVSYDEFIKILTESQQNNLHEHDHEQGHDHDDHETKEDKSGEQ